MTNSNKHYVLGAVQKALDVNGARCKLIANALRDANGEYWTAVLITNPGNTFDRDDKYVAAPDIHALDTKQRLPDTLPSQARVSHRSGYIYHSTDKDALLGLCHHLLLDAVFRLWAFADSLQEFKDKNVDYEHIQKE